MHTDIIIVSGLPRSGTSLLMQMLDNGGLEVVTDGARTADVDNPKGYYELEKVKQIERDASWLAATRGKAFKMVSQLLYHLPAGEQYRIIFMQRDFDEMLASQEKMLTRLGRPTAPRGEMKAAFASHLSRLRDWLARQSNMRQMDVSYNELLAQPAAHAQRIREFVAAELDVERMASTVDPALYRNRSE